MSDIQTLSHQLHSARKLQLLGLAAALKSLCKEFEKQQMAEIDSSSYDLPDLLAIDISLSIFRVAQEALHNSAKQLWRSPPFRECDCGQSRGALHLTVQDSGSGFDREAVKQGRGLGLT